MSGAALRVGLIGAGWVTAYHLQAWQKLAGRALVVAVCDPQRAQAETRAREFGIGAVYTSAAEMLIVEQLDLVDIAVPRAAHVAMTELAASHGLAVLCQKPLAPTLKEAEALVARVNGRVPLMVHENWRFRPNYRQIAAWLADNRIGTIKAVRMNLVTSGMRADKNGHFPALERQPFMRNETRMLVAEVLIHHLDTLRMLLGPLQVKAASLSSTCPELRGEDGAAIHMERPDGTGVSLFANLCVHGEPATLTDRLDLIGEHGTIRLDGRRLSCLGSRPEFIEYDMEANYQRSYDEAIRHFVERLESGEGFETDARDNLKTLFLVEECYRLAGWEG